MLQAAALDRRAWQPATPDRTISPSGTCAGSCNGHCTAARKMRSPPDRLTAHEPRRSCTPPTHSPPRCTRSTSNPAAAHRRSPAARRLRPPGRAQRHLALPRLRRPRLSVRGQPAVQALGAADAQSRQLAGGHARPAAEADLPAAVRLLARGAGSAERLLGRTFRHRRDPQTGGSAAAPARRRRALRDPGRAAKRAGRLHPEQSRRRW